MARADDPAPARPECPITTEITSRGLIAILRAPTAEHFPAIAATLLDAGIHAIEITLTTHGALRCIRELTAAYGPEAVIGAGTVLTVGQAQTCVDAGARFLVSPVTAPDVVRTARAAGVAAYPGALTPTEIHAAGRTGAPAVKLFPASAVSPRYVSDLRGPLPGIPLIPTGGISLTGIPAWIAAGVAAVGLGTPLIGTAATEGADDHLAARCRQAIAAVSEGRAAR
ncbi:KHG/KDPG aldolase [Streptomyces sp. ADI96-15]|uniref:bifunctional 4-hydroxy-2-oxoglutarate aldolase/2-dehydro-3-deoxy-phosphogluconate aldolase n=1 Tax=Streptomyces TaxID=1883 RepID=UPI0002F46C77|nr:MULTISPECIES: bifunctional 4-hydroxy-2-oxoglutarate aldolase/2-dehydro-3-deoxy-phosphogluconate aldolase [Streptomyces]QOZ99056.1 2-dehydro-3-deoxyphosphogluconate aldolase [Streptomyces violascens]ESP99568.1 aldolase [Streptomyces sp. GBA 94-10 4N24]ESQ05615.1 aldolase [Streptomyces sp. PVA_94-07]RPK59361.1 KHG/KDPG aldolase [Streptomyces sp. ADI96-15]RWZ77381.1 bifunctional 4-hydroxy-2-oxoglutarate aldolase/2-dehydro-3-deoxy-phosphogluconate aldolase [Streptomyces albidoflavus]